MALVKPFRATRYKASKDLATLVCPPYDVIDDAREQALLSANEHNIVRVELSHAGAHGHQPEERYQQAGDTLRAWIAEGVLATDEKPSYYVHSQTYTGPDGVRRERRGFFGLVKLERFEEGGAVRPHETTLPAPKADRLQLIAATRTNTSPIFSLFDDPPGSEGDGTAAQVLRRATAPAASFTDENDIEHKLWVVDDDDDIAVLTEALARSQIYIADGHHRYETALEYQSLQVGPGPWDDVLMYLAPANDPGLAVFPIHRVVKLEQAVDESTFKERLSSLFELEPVDSGAITQRLADSTRTIGVHGPGVGGSYLLKGRNGALDAFLASKDVPSALAALDITVLHTAVLEHMGISFSSGLDFTHDAQDAVRRTDAGEFDMAFLVNATRISQMMDVVEAGQTMPQKSTFFYPKLATGLVLRHFG